MCLVEGLDKPALKIDFEICSHMPRPTSERSFGARICKLAITITVYHTWIEMNLVRVFRAERLNCYQVVTLDVKLQVLGLDPTVTEWQVGANSGSPRRTGFVQTPPSTIPRFAGTTQRGPMASGFLAQSTLLIFRSLFFFHHFNSSVLRENYESHLRKCPLLKQAQSLSVQPFYQKGINGGKDEKDAEDFDGINSEMKRKAVYSLTLSELYILISKIKSIHASLCGDIQDSHKIPDSCDIWVNREVDRKLPFQEKHVLQQASILGNLEEFGVLKASRGGKDREKSDCDGSSSIGDNDVPAVVEFGAGRGYLTQVLSDCYGIKKVFLVERKAYKLKADRSLRQKENVTLERLRIDSKCIFDGFAVGLCQEPLGSYDDNIANNEAVLVFEDLNLNAVEPLQGVPYLATGKHLCGPATDMTLRCCLAKRCAQGSVDKCSTLRGLAIATCCHHLCQWRHYISNLFSSLLLNLYLLDYYNVIFSGEEERVVTTRKLILFFLVELFLNKFFTLCFDSEKEECGMDSDSCGVEETLRNMEAVERAVLGFMCKDIIDMGRLMWIKERGLESKLVKYVPSNISPENHLLIARLGVNL
ncbi:hypothetical protein RJ640_021676 [Escallonia rubra]|uniref:tRNA:m(4)X modification enzyme TRM13 n=1 Tax=Escallonia rubra TaxID=112253 RepID=A0AA88R4T2_9ASTE|nr:hypothetical protein RJ640_021676 [Escallonia rubra]